VYAKIDLASHALDHDGSSCAASSLACPFAVEGAELISNGGFEATSNGDDHVHVPPGGWASVHVYTFGTR